MPAAARGRVPVANGRLAVGFRGIRDRGNLRRDRAQSDEQPRRTIPTTGFPWAADPRLLMPWTGPDRRPLLDASLGPVPDVGRANDDRCAVGVHAGSRPDLADSRRDQPRCRFEIKVG